MKRICVSRALLLIAAFLAATTAGSKARAGRAVIIDAFTLELLSVGGLAEGVSGANVVFFGELHGRREHHNAMIRLIKAMDAPDRGIAIGLEMMRGGSQKDLDAWVAGEIPEDKFAAVFAENWGAEYWEVYRSVFFFARENRIPMAGLNLDREIVGKVSRAGLASLSSGEVPKVRGMHCDADRRYREHLKSMLAGHPKSYDFVNFCEAQLLWDAAMARSIIDYINDHPGRTMVVLAGASHSWKHGIPSRLRNHSALSWKVILPSSDRDLYGYAYTPADADYVWWFDDY